VVVVAFTAWQITAKFSLLDAQISSLMEANKLAVSDGIHQQFAEYTNSVGLYEAVKDKVTIDQAQGVDVSSANNQLPQAIDLILGAKYTDANNLLNSLSANLDSLLKAKQAADQATKGAVASTGGSTAKKSTGGSSAGCVPVVGGYCHGTIKTSQGSFTTYIVAVSASSIITDTDNDNDCTSNCPAKPLASYVSQDGGSAGMHGTYFCPPDYSSCASEVNSYFYPVWNTRLGKWLEQGKLGLSNRAMMAFTGSGPTFCAVASSCAGIGGLHAAIVNEPGLVGGGKDIVGNYSLTSDQEIKSTRGGIAARGDTVYFVIATNATVPNLAAVMVSIGADSALNLDGGGSAAMMYHGKYVVGPGRQLPNAIVSK
jgi:hypothetical protein